MRESNRMLPSREGNPGSPQRHEYSGMVGTHHPVGFRSIVAGRFWADRGGATTSRHGCEHATAYGCMAPLSFSSSKLVLTGVIMSAGLAIREGRLVAWTHAVSEIVMGNRPVGPVGFTARNLVYDIACEASIMGTIPQAILPPVEDPRQILTMRPEAIQTHD